MIHTVPNTRVTIVGDEIVTHIPIAHIAGISVTFEPGEQPHQVLGYVEISYGSDTIGIEFGPTERALDFVNQVNNAIDNFYSTKR